MPEFISPLLFQDASNAQASATAFEFESVDFSLANDEAVIISQVEFITPMQFPLGSIDALYQALFTLDPSPGPATSVSGAAVAVFDSDVFWSPAVAPDLVTSGYGGYWDRQLLRDFSQTPQGGILTAQSMSVGFNTNNIGATLVARVFYNVVSLSDRELVNLVARRRAR